VQNQSGWFGRAGVNQQNDHLTVALICPMMWTGTILQIHAGSIQVERLHDAQSCQRKALPKPGEQLIVRVISREEGSE
jgi:hypothetical protein